MSELIKFIDDKLIRIYSIIYLVFLEFLAIIFISIGEIDFTMNNADIILKILIIIFYWIISHIIFFLPTLFVIVLGSIISLFMSISIPLFLMLAFFQFLGAETVSVLDYGFWKILLICILITPLGILNIWSLKILAA